MGRTVGRRPQHDPHRFELIGIEQLVELPGAFLGRLPTRENGFGVGLPVPAGTVPPGAPQFEGLSGEQNGPLFRDRADPDVSAALILDNERVIGKLGR